MDKEKQKNLNFIEEKKDLDKYSDIVFLPVSIENLADYIANGFVGLLTKKDKVQDYQSTFWPQYKYYDTHQLKSIHLKEDTALISTDKKNTKIFQDNLSMLNVSDIFFPSKDGGKGKYLLYVGRVAIEKNIEEFLKLDTEMKKVVVGGGPKLNSYKKKYKDVDFLGYKQGKELADIYRDAACFVFPSKTDTFGIVLIEALACGTPIAGFNVTGPKDIVVNGVNGSLTDDNLLDAVNKALKCNREVVNETSIDYTWEKVTQQFINSLVPVK